MSSVSDFMAAVSRAEEAYEYMISFAGQGIGREIQTNDVEEIREFLEQFRDALEGTKRAGREIPAEFDLAGESYYHSVLDGMDEEYEEALDILQLLIEQDRITSQQVDNLNGMSVFQSVIMKLFFLEELTKHFDQ